MGRRGNAGVIGSYVNTNAVVPGMLSVNEAELRTFMTGTEDNRPTGINGLYYAASNTLRNFFYVGGAWTVLGVGPDKCTWGPFTDSQYLSSTTTGASVGPQFVNPYTLALGLYVTATPGTNQQQLLSFSNTGATTGWNLGAGLTASNKLAMSLRGASPVTTEFTGMSAITTGAHGIAIKYNGTNLSYSWDGAAVTNSGVTGVSAAGGGDRFLVGRWLNAGLACSWAAIAWIRGYAAAVSDADLQTLSGSASTYLPPVITTLPAYDWQARWYLNDATTFTPGGSVSSQNLALNGNTSSSTLIKTNR